MRATLLTDDIKTHVTPEMKSGFELLAAARGVRPSIVQREAFTNHIKANSRKLARLRSRLSAATKIEQATKPNNNSKC